MSNISGVLQITLSLLNIHYFHHRNLEVPHKRNLPAANIPHTGRLTVNMGVQKYETCSTLYMIWF